MSFHSSDIETETTSGGKRWILPRRALPFILRIIPIGIWSIFLGILSFFFITKIWPVIQTDEPAIDFWFDLAFDGIFVLFGLITLGVVGFWGFGQHSRVSGAP